MLRFSPDVFPVGGWGLEAAGLELAGEIGIILKTHAVGNLADAFVCRPQKLAGPVDPVIEQIDLGGEADIPLEHLVKIGPVDVNKIGDVLDADLAGIVVVNIVETLLKIWRILVLFQGIRFDTFKKGIQAEGEFAVCGVRENRGGAHVGENSSHKVHIFCAAEGGRDAGKAGGLDQSADFAPPDGDPEILPGRFCVWKQVRRLSGENKKALAFRELYGLIHGLIVAGSGGYKVKTVIISWKILK